MGFLLPDKEIKNTLANVDATVTEVREHVLPRVIGILSRVDFILADVQAIAKAAKDIFVKPRT
jgi:hypothetical protein